jgi:hypothetical protein
MAVSFLDPVSPRNDLERKVLDLDRETAEAAACAAAAVTTGIELEK